jgi:predicted AlkP superfamily pyrophosphatase or phosphodiesterase
MRRHSAHVAGALALFVAACHAGGVPATTSSKSPRGTGLGLAVLISIDQLRADQAERLRPRFGAGGFRRLYEQGVAYERAEYAHSATETAVGHATLSTGALPRDHGIVGNEWSENGLRVYAVDDRAQELLGGAGEGKSPWRLLSETIGDVLVAERPGALVRSVSLKERSAILMAGRAGMAFWLDDAAGTFVTSRFYAERLPDWVASFGAGRPTDGYRAVGWPLFASERKYSAPDDRAWERGQNLGGVRFPHSFGQLVGDRFVHALRTTPFGDELTAAFVRRMFEHEQVGRDDVPDLLLLSLSATDYIGHAFGPESREAEDNLLRLDRTLERLLLLLDEHVGKGRYFVVLTSDHGGCETPEWFSEQGLDAGRIDPEALKSTVDGGLRERFGIGVQLVSDFVNPSLVLNEQRIASLSLELEAVEHAAVELALTVPGVHAAYTRSDLVAGSTPPNPFKQRLEQSTHKERSGHVYVVPKEHWLLATNPAPLAAMHGTPWPYDAQVPLVVHGTGAASQRVSRPVDPRDIAPTLAKLLGIRAPRSASGQLLLEALPASKRAAVTTP